MDPRSRQLAAEPSGLNEGIEPSPQDLDLCSTSELVRSQAHLAPASCWTRRGPGRAVRIEETTASDGPGNTLAGTWTQRAPARSWEPGDSPVTPLDSAEVERRHAAWSLTWRKAPVSRLPLHMLEWAGRAPHRDPGIGSRAQSLPIRMREEWFHCVSRDLFRWASHCFCSSGPVSPEGRLRHRWRRALPMSWRRQLKGTGSPSVPSFPWSGMKALGTPEQSHSRFGP